MFKNSCPFIYRDSLYVNGQDFLEILNILRALIVQRYSKSKFVFYSKNYNFRNKYSLSRVSKKVQKGYNSELECKLKNVHT